MRAVLIAAVFCVLGLWLAREARACGCFTPPDPTVPIVQAGERILFERKDGVVTAHIQIHYAGNASEFGWLLPLPSLPELRLGTDELFTQLIRTTQPKYTLRIVTNGCVVLLPGGAFSDARPLADGPASGGGGGNPVVVVESSIGPYDYAVLRADSREPMLAWLRDNRYFVPAGTEDVVGPYIHPGSYFLALKLRSGKSAGDLQPVVVRYPSDLPMIPITLTSVAAQPDMGIQVWMLGETRAIPRNYAHTVLNDAAIDWLGFGRNYNDLVIRATREAPGRHTFVTEYAGSSAIMVGLLDYQGRFGSVAELAGQPSVMAFIQYLNGAGYASGFPRAYTSELLGIVGAYLPVPRALAERGVGLASFYGNIDYWLGFWAGLHPEDFADWQPRFEPAAIAAELDERIVKPTREAGQLFRDHPYLTRLYTTLSPEHMNRDPVFSENRDLGNVNNVHQGTLTYSCAGGYVLPTTPATLVTEQGFIIQYPRGTGGTILPKLPGSRRIELLGEEGPPDVQTNNDETINRLLTSSPPAPDGGVVVVPDGGGLPSGAVNRPDQNGCAVGGGGRESSLLGALLLLGAARFRSRRRGML